MNGLLAGCFRRRGAARSGRDRIPSDVGHVLARLNANEVRPVLWLKDNKVPMFDRTTIEKRFGPLFRKRVAEKRTDQEKKSHAARKQNRSGVPNTLGGALAEIFVTIEHLYLYALTLERADGRMNPFSISFSRC